MIKYLGSGILAIFLVASSLGLASILCSSSAVWARPQVKADQKRESHEEIRDRVKKLYGDAEVEDFKVQASAVVGAAYTGVVVHEAKDHSELMLDVLPCKGHVEVFNKPYDSRPTGKTVACNGKSFDEFNVRQKKGISCHIEGIAPLVSDLCPFNPSANAANEAEPFRLR